MNADTQNRAIEAGYAHALSGDEVMISPKDATMQAVPTAVFTFAFIK